MKSEADTKQTVWEQTADFQLDGRKVREAVIAKMDTLFIM